MTFTDGKILERKPERVVKPKPRQVFGHLVREHEGHRYHISMKATGLEVRRFHTRKERAAKLSFPDVTTACGQKLLL